MCNKFLDFFIVCFIALAVMLSSCNNGSKENFIENFRTFMAQVDSGSKNYTNAEWQTADEQFTDFKENQYPVWEDLMTPIEKDNVNEMIGKYRSLEVKRSVQEAKSQVKDVLDQTKTIFNDLTTDTTLIK